MYISTKNLREKDTSSKHRLLLNRDLHQDSHSNRCTSLQRISEKMTPLQNTDRWQDSQSPTLPQKRHMLSAASTTRALYFRQRALYVGKRALHHRKRAINFRRRLPQDREKEKESCRTWHTWVSHGTRVSHGTWYVFLMRPSSYTHVSFDI